MHHRTNVTLAALLCLCSCSGLELRRIGWQCTATVAAGPVAVSSTRHLAPDGSFRYEAHSWELRQHDTDAEVDLRIGDWFGTDGSQPDRIGISIYLGRTLRGRIVEVDVGPDDGNGPTKDPIWSQRNQQDDYLLVRPAAALLALQRPVFVTGYDRQLRRAFRIPIEVDSVASALAGVESAKRLSQEMAQDFRSRCEVERDAGIIVLA